MTNHKWKEVKPYREWRCIYCNAKRYRELIAKRHYITYADAEGARRGSAPVCDRLKNAVTLFSEVKEK